MTKPPWISPGEQRYVCCADAIYLISSNAIYTVVYDMLPLATWCDKIPQLRSKYIAPKVYRFPQENIANPNGIYIAKQKICFPKKADFIVLLGISP